MNTEVQNCTTVSEAREAHRQGRRWRLRCVYVGYNAENTSRHSSKFWQLEGSNGRVTRRWGRIGRAGRSGSITFHEGVDKFYEKTGKGYRVSVR